MKGAAIMRYRILLLAIVVNALLWSALAFQPTRVADAHAGCATTYVVRYGDWLAAIARRYGTTVSQLLALNPQLYWRMNVIYPGEVICISQSGQSQQQQQNQQQQNLRVSTRNVSLEASFQITVSSEMSITLQAPMETQGKRKVLALRDTDGVTFIARGEDISPTLALEPPPKLIGIRTGANALDFTLIEVGTPEILSAMRWNDEPPMNLAEGCGALPVVDVMGSSEAQTLGFVLWVEGADGKRFPFPIANVGRVSQSQVMQCYGNQINFAFALFPSSSTQGEPYHLVLRAVPKETGPNYGDDLRYLCYVLGLTYLCGNP